MISDASSDYLSFYILIRMCMCMCVYSYVVCTGVYGIVFVYGCNFLCTGWVVDTVAIATFFTFRIPKVY